MLGLRDIIEQLGGELAEENLRRLKEYRERYGAEECKSSLYGDL